MEVVNCAEGKRRCHRYRKKQKKEKEKGKRTLGNLRLIHSLIQGGGVYGKEIEQPMAF